MSGLAERNTLKDGVPGEGREKAALRAFELRLRDLKNASLRMIDAAVELRDARAARQGRS